ncbi:MAG: hypothetical protein QW794_02570 [Thermosphaera sp.]
MSSGDSPLQKDRFLREEVYNRAVNVGSLMLSTHSDREKKPVKGVDETTINNMISLFLTRSSQGSVKEALNEVVLYIARQVGRGEISREVGQQLMEDIRTIYNIFKNDEKGLESALSKYLIMAKWVYDSGIEGVRNLEELMNAFKKVQST